MNKDKQKDKISIKIDKENNIVIKGKLRPRLSNSGKSTMLFTTNGNIELPKSYKGRPIKLGINCYSTKPKKSKNTNIIME